MCKNFILGCSGMYPVNVSGIITNYSSLLRYLIVLPINFTAYIRVEITHQNGGIFEPPFVSVRMVKKYPRLV